MKFKNRQIIATLIVAILLSGVIGIFVPKVIAGSNPSDLLQVSGQWIVDSNGNRIELRGAGSDYTAYTEPSSITQYISWLKNAGCDVVRLGFVFPDTGSWGTIASSSIYDTATMKSVVSQFWSAGIYSILQDGDDWATVADQGVNDIIPIYSANWIADWVGVANDFKNNPAVAAFELTNEPYDTNGNNAATMRQLYTECTAAIRATGDNHIVLAWAGNFTDPSQILPNMVLDYHDWWAYGTEKSKVSAGGYNLFPEDTDNSPNNYITAEIEASNSIAQIVVARSFFNCSSYLR